MGTSKKIVKKKKSRQKSRQKKVADFRERVTVREVCKITFSHILSLGDNFKIAAPPPLVSILRKVRKCFFIKKSGNICALFPF